METITYRTHEGCHVTVEATIRETGERDEDITLSTTLPPPLRIERSYQAIDQGGRTWRT